MSYALQVQLFLVPRPSLTPVFEHIQYLRSKTGAWETETEACSFQFQLCRHFDWMSQLARETVDNWRSSSEKLMTTGLMMTGGHHQGNWSIQSKYQQSFVSKLKSVAHTFSSLSCLIHLLVLDCPNITLHGLANPTQNVFPNVNCADARGVFFVNKLTTPNST